jgi:hypothetical protein
MDRPVEWGAESFDDVLDVLHDIVLWELTPPRWAQVEQLLVRIAAAHAAGDAAELRVAAAELERIGPARALRIGSTTIAGIPEPVLERRHTLVRVLTGEQPPERPAGSGDWPAR